MIFYFSATGNSKHVAESIASKGEKLISIAEAMDKGQHHFSVTDDRVGIVSPNYDWTLPSIVSEFLAQLELRFEKKPYLFYVATYGTTSGASVAMADRIMREKGLPFDACFDIKMPDTWTPIFDLSDHEHVRSILEGSEKEIAEVKGQIDEKVTGRQMGPTTPYFTRVIGKALHDGYTRKTSHLSVATPASAAASAHENVQHTLSRSRTARLCGPRSVASCALAAFTAAPSSRSAVERARHGTTST